MWEKFQKLFSTIKNNRALTFTILGLLLISTFVNFRILDHDKAVVLIEGEKPSDMNFIPILAKNPLFDQGKSLELSADKSVSYGIIIGVVDAARVAGIQNITAFTKKSIQSTN